MDTYVNLEETRRLLAKITSENPDLVYAPDGGVNGACQYFPAEQINPADITLGEDDTIEDYLLPEIQLTTGCQVGAVAKEIFGRWPGWEGGIIGLGHVIDTYDSDEGKLHGDPFPFTELAARYLQVAQQAQDSGESWGTSYGKAEAFIVDYLSRGASVDGFLMKALDGTLTYNDTMGMREWHAAVKQQRADAQQIGV